MKIRFACPNCERPARLDLSGPRDWECPACDHPLRFAAGMGNVGPSACLICGNQELYKKKNFPHWLGLTILTVASLTFIVAQGMYWPTLAWTILIASAVVDGLLYLWVGDAIVCYRCGAHYPGAPASDHHMPFELGTHERYRQERLRREQLQADNNPH